MSFHSFRTTNGQIMQWFEHSDGSVASCPFWQNLFPARWVGVPSPTSVSVAPFNVTPFNLPGAWRFTFGHWEFR